MHNHYGEAMQISIPIEKKKSARVFLVIESAELAERIRSINPLKLAADTYLKSG